MRWKGSKKIEHAPCTLLRTVYILFSVCGGDVHGIPGRIAWNSNFNLSHAQRWKKSFFGGAHGSYVYPNLLSLFRFTVNLHEMWVVGRKSNHYHDLLTLPSAYGLLPTHGISAWNPFLESTKSYLWFYVWTTRCTHGSVQSTTLWYGVWLWKMKQAGLHCTALLLVVH